jgi:hypothetical protein
MPILKTPPGMSTIPAGTRRLLCDFPANIVVNDADNVNAAIPANINEICFRLFHTILDCIFSAIDHDYRGQYIKYHYCHPGRIFFKLSTVLDLNKPAPSQARDRFTMTS